MALCSSCQNIVPQSAARCAVCGNVPGISADDFIASLGSEATDTADQTAGDAWPPDAVQSTAPNGRVFTPPPIPSTDPSAPTGRSDDVAPIPARRGSSRLPSDPTPDDFSIDDDPEVDEIVRTVRAISNRLDADIRIGRRSGHRFFATAAPLAAAALVAFGTYTAYTFADLGRPERSTPIEETAQPGTLAFGEEQSALAQAAAQAVAGHVHEVVSLNCGVPTTANAIALSPTRLVTNASAIANDDRPIIRFADNTSRAGTVVGIDFKADLVVIELDALAGTETMQWGVADRILSDPSVVVVERFGAAINGTPATVDNIDGVIGLIKTFGFSGASFRPGAAVLNSDGFVIGMVDDTGLSAIGGAELSAAFSRVIARPSAPVTNCPGDETLDSGAAATATGEPTEGDTTG